MTTTGSGDCLSQVSVVVTVVQGGRGRGRSWSLVVVEHLRSTSVAAIDRLVVSLCVHIADLRLSQLLHGGAALVKGFNPVMLLTIRSDQWSV